MHSKFSMLDPYRFRFAAKIASGMTSWTVSLPKVAHELLCRTSQTKWWPSETLGWSNPIFCTINFPFIMVSGGHIMRHEILMRRKNCTVALGALMFRCDSFPCRSRTVALTRTGIANVWNISCCGSFHLTSPGSPTICRTSVKHMCI